MYRAQLICSFVSIASVSLLAACAGGADAHKGDEETAVEKSPRAERTDTIAAVHEDNREEIASCFTDAVEQEQLTGREYAEVELRLPASGSPASIRLLDPEDYPEPLRNCLEEVFADLSYGEGERGATFYQMLRFDAEKRELEFRKPVDAYRRWGLTGDEIDSVVHDRKSEIDACYRRAEEETEGRVLVTVAVDSDGHVSRATLKSSELDSEPVESCLLDIAAGFEFPEPRGGGVVVFDFPFRFDSEEGWLEEGVPGM